MNNKCGPEETGLQAGGKKDDLDITIKSYLVYHSESTANRPRGTVFNHSSFSGIAPHEKLPIKAARLSFFENHTLNVKFDEDISLPVLENNPKSNEIPVVRLKRCSTYNT